MRGEEEGKLNRKEPKVDVSRNQIVTAATAAAAEGPAAG